MGNLDTHSAIDLHPEPGHPEPGHPLPASWIQVDVQLLRAGFKWMSNSSEWMSNFSDSTCRARL